jgi:hypothetical protein
MFSSVHHFLLFQLNLLSVTVGIDGGLIYKQSLHMNDQMFRYSANSKVNNIKSLAIFKCFLFVKRNGDFARSCFRVNFIEEC